MPESSISDEVLYIEDSKRTIEVGFSGLKKSINQSKFYFRRQGPYMIYEKQEKEKTH